MPTRIEVNVQTGEVKQIELVGEELAAYEASLAAQQATALAAQEEPHP
jgi:hypothetical protein